MSRNLYQFLGLAFFALLGGVVFRAYLSGDILPLDVNKFQAAVSSLVSGSDLTGSVAVPAPAFVFSRDLYFGIRSSDDVRQLQGFLADRGFYKGPVTGNFFSLTLAGVKKMQSAYAIIPVAGYVGPKTRAVLNSILSKAASETAQVATKPAESPVEVPAAPQAIVTVAPTVLESSVKIVTSYPAYSISSYRDQVLHEFKLQNGVAEGKIAVTKIKFKNVGTLRAGNMVGPRLINSLTGDILATVDEGSDGTIEFVLSPNLALSDNGLMVSGGVYSIRADLRATNTIEKPYIILSIESAADITAADYNNLSRSATLTTKNIFPILGPKITLPY